MHIISDRYNENNRWNKEMWCKVLWWDEVIQSVIKTIKYANN